MRSSKFLAALFLIVAGTASAHPPPLRRYNSPVPHFTAWTVPIFQNPATTTHAHSLAAAVPTGSAGRRIVVTGGGNANANGDSILVTDAVGNSYTVVQGYRNSTVTFAFIAWTTTNNTTSFNVTVADTSNGATQFNRVGMATHTQASQTGSNNDAQVSVCNGTPQTINPTVTSGLPTKLNEMFFAVYYSASAESGINYVEDPVWNNLNSFGDASSSVASAYLVNTTPYPRQHNPTTSSQPYEQCVVGFIHS